VESELELLSACIRWAKAEAHRRGLRQVPSVLREVLGPVLKYLRYLALCPDDLAEIADEELGETIAQVLVENFNDDGEFMIMFRNPPNHETFYAFGLVDECFERHIVDEYSENTYDVFSQAFSSSGDFCSTQLGVQIPTQIRPENCTNTDTYEEDLTILLFDFTARKMLSVTRYTNTVKYDAILNIPFDQKAKLDMKRVRKVVKIIFHKSGTYPSQYSPENGDKNELVCCDFCGTQDAKLWHKKSYSYIRYCAYTVDTDKDC
jgi:hypothetical protein